MKIKIICPYCRKDDFEPDFETFECNTCGEIIEPDELEYEKIEEN